ncbi:unnamed protein product [Agarophyton chilense]
MHSASQPPLIPPFRFTPVEHFLYRGAYPTRRNLNFLNRLNLRTVLSLQPDKPSPSNDLTQYCAANHVSHLCYHVDKYDDKFSHTQHLVASLLSIMIDPNQHPLFIHCRDGAHNTGLVIMCLRRLQNWNLPIIYREFTRYTKNNDISFEEKQFVQAFNAKVTIPLTIPTWLWQGVRHKVHPSIQLELQTDVAPVSPSTPNPQSSFDTASPHHAQRVVLGNTSKHAHMKLHYSLPVAALDVLGMHFVKCCVSATRT